MALKKWKWASRDDVGTRLDEDAMSIAIDAAAHGVVVAMTRRALKAYWEARDRQEKGRLANIVRREKALDETAKRAALPSNLDGAFCPLSYRGKYTLKSLRRGR